MLSCKLSISAQNAVIEVGNSEESDAIPPHKEKNKFFLYEEKSIYVQETKVTPVLAIV